MPEYEVVQIGSIGPRFDQELARRYQVLSLPHGDIPNDLQEQVSQTPILVTSVRKGLTETLIRQLPALKAVCSWGVGHDTLDIGAAKARGIAVSTTPDVLNDCVADLAWALLLATAREVVVADRYVKEGHWRAAGQFPEAIRVSRKKLGILGMGRIGQAIARRGQGFDMEVGYHNRSRRGDATGVYFSELPALADWADFLIIACPGGEQTYHLVDSTVLRALGPNGVLINIARGSVVDQRALESALLNGVISGAGLDVLEKEPDHPETLRDMDRVVLTPHIGSCTYDTRREMEELVLDNVEAFFANGNLLTPVP